MDAQGIQLRPAADSPADPAPEVERLESLLAGRRAELSALQEGFREFKARYAQAVGARLAELAEVEREIRRAEARLLGLEEDEGADADEELKYGRDALAQMADAVSRKIKKARNRLAHLS